MQSKKLPEDGKPRSPIKLVRTALDSVRDDVRAIYGSAQQPKGMRQKALEMDSRMARRKCFFRPDGTGPQAQFRKLWDIAQVFLLLYVALAVPYRISFGIEVPPKTSWFWIEVVIGECHGGLLLGFRARALSLSLTHSLSLSLSLSLSIFFFFLSPSLCMASGVFSSCILPKHVP